VPLDLGRRLLATSAVHAGEVRRALISALSSSAPFHRALADSSAAVRTLLSKPPEGELVVRSVIPDMSLVAELPEGLPARLLAVPMRKDARTGTIDIAVTDPSDAHLLAELSFHTSGHARLVGAPLPAIESALLLIAPPKFQRVPTADFAKVTPPAEPPALEVARSPESQAVIGPITSPREDAVPLLVRRSSRSMQSVTPPPPSVRMESEPPSAIPLSRTRATGTPPTTAPLVEEKAADSAPVQMVVDFRRATRAEKDEAASRPAKRKLEPKRPPFPSLTRVLETIDAAGDRAALIEALLRGLLTTSVGAALFAPRRGRFVGVGAIGEVEPERMKHASLSLGGAVAESIAKNERLGTLDPNVDLDLYTALGLERFSAVHVLIQPSFVADKAAMLLVAFGMGDVLESQRRARVLATAAAAALERLLRK
jgi:hypothetical protein